MFAIRQNALQLHHGCRAFLGPVTNEKPRYKQNLNLKSIKNRVTNSTWTCSQWKTALLKELGPVANEKPRYKLNTYHSAAYKNRQLRKTNEMEYCQRPEISSQSKAILTSPTILNDSMRNLLLDIMKFKNMTSCHCTFRMKICTNQMASMYLWLWLDNSAMISANGSFVS